MFWRKSSILILDLYDSVNIQPDIMQNHWKNMQENHKYFEMTIGIFKIFNFFYILDILILWLNILS